MSKERKEARIISISLVWVSCGRGGEAYLEVGSEKDGSVNKISLICARHYEKSRKLTYYFIRVMKGEEPRQSKRGFNRGLWGIKLWEGD